jgi:dTDP-4-amino-4,6-dideoxygalactose transaminase
LTEPEPIPEAGIRRANELMRSGRLFRYGEMGVDQLDVSMLEDEFAKFIGRKYCIAVNSGGGALFLALKVLGVAAGDPVLVNGFTLAPVPGAILHAGARPIIVDVGENYTIDCDDLEQKAKASGAKVLMLSHMRGHIADMARVMSVAKSLNLQVVEDCAHAIGASFNGRTIGTFGAVAAFSAQTYKHLNAGEGGFVVLDDADQAARAILYSGSYMLHGQHRSKPGEDVLARHSEHTPNFSMRMTALAAALIRPQVQDLPRRIARWGKIYDRIAAGLALSQHVRLPERAPNITHTPTSIQFSMMGLDASEIEQFLQDAKARGLPIKWFGAERQLGFTSAPRNWRYAGPQGVLERTHNILAKLCDIRTPVTLSDDDCDLIAEIVTECVDSIVRRRQSTRNDSPLQGRAASTVTHLGGHT